MRTVTYILPAYWASALINDNRSGMSDTDEADLSAFLDNAADDIAGIALDCSDEPSFRMHHDAAALGVLACECLTYTFPA